ncbi:MAG: FG-GAP-like repeat-containing protein [Vicinamibacteria bacterium]
MNSSNFAASKRGRLALAVLSSAFAAQAAAQAVSFRPAQHLAVGANPQVVAVGDFDGDSLADLAVANAGSASVSILLGNGDGSFGPRQDFPVSGVGPTSVTVADFDGNAVQDLVTTNKDSSNVSVLLGNGDGSFQPALLSAAGGSWPNAAAVADFDGDGDRDLAVATFNGGTGTTFSVLLGNGNGSFQAPLTLAAQQSPLWLVAGDVDGDGNADVVTANFRTDVPSTVSVVRGNGDGSFQPAQHFAAGSGPAAVILGHFDADPLTDLAVANYGLGAPPGTTLSVLLGTRGGAFGAAQTYAAGNRPITLSIGDFDGDGVEDLVAAIWADLAGSTAQGTTVSVLRGNGDGSFGLAQSFTAGRGVVGTAVADFDRDGKPDLAVANYSADSVSILLNDTGASTSHVLSVTKSGAGAGTVTSSPAGIDCGSDCSEAYASGSLVTLTATPSAGSTFAGWSGGGCSGTGACSVVMTASTTVAAAFDALPAQTFTLAVSRAGTGGGSVTSSPAGISCGSDCSEDYASGTLVTLIATPAGGSTFAGWSGACSGTGACNVSMTAARSVTATFDALPPQTFPLAVTKAGTGGGTVSSTPAGISCGSDCSEDYASGTVVALTATPDAGSAFAGWGGACSGTGACTVSMSAARSVTATFNKLRFTLTVSKSGLGLGSVSSSPAGINCGTLCSGASASFDHGTTITLSASPALSPLSAFDGWSGGGCSGTGPCTVTLTANTTVTARFRLLGLF